MALINCPECDGQVSDKADACIHCGFPLTSDEEPAEQTEIDAFGLDDESTATDEPRKTIKDELQALMVDAEAAVTRREQPGEEDSESTPDDEASVDEEPEEEPVDEEPAAETSQESSDDGDDLDDTTSADDPQEVETITTESGLELKISTEKEWVFYKSPDFLVSTVWILTSVVLFARQISGGGARSSDHIAWSFLDPFYAAAICGLYFLIRAMAPVFRGVEETPAVTRSRQVRLFISLCFVILAGLKEVIADLFLATL